LICNVKDIPVYYEEYGEGKPVLCLHGCWVDHRLMTGCLEPFFNKIKGFRRIYLDYAGMGKTPASSWIKSADDMLELIKYFIEQIIPDENFLIIGESYGGYFSLGLIREIKEKIDGIMLICPDIHTKTLNKKHPVKQTIWKSDQFKMMENDTDVDAFLDKAVIATPEIYEKFKKDILSGIKMADVGFLKNYGYAFTFEDELETIEFDKPVCILTGRQDHVVGYHNAYEILDRFPRAAFSVLDCAGHNLQNEIGPLFNEYIRNWLWRIELFSNKS
jgi:pimeloyl-ACP methyl ester carboxylesterase